MSRLAIPLTGTGTDLARLERLTRVVNERTIMAPWGFARGSNHRGSAIWPIEPFSVEVAQRVGAIPIEPIPEGGFQAAHLRLDGPSGVAPSLAEAIPPIRVDGDPPTDEALFMVPVASGGAQRYLERLLLLGRDDVGVASWKNGTELSLRVRNPPLYLLMRARDEPSDGVRVYARSESERVWVAWGYNHPLTRPVAEACARSGQVGVVDPSGSWHFLPQNASEVSIYEVLRPILPVPQSAWAPDEGVPELEVRLRLGLGREADPELWLLSPEAFFDLEDFIETVSQEDLRRLMVTRLSDAAGEIYYVLRERTAGRSTHLSPKLSPFVNQPGFVKHEALDGLYLPVGRQLKPKMRREDLRRMLNLPEGQLAILREDEGGLQLVVLNVTSEAALTDWIHFVALDRRLVLDQLAESAVFALPEMTVVSLGTSSTLRSSPPPPKAQAPRSPPPPKIQPKPGPKAHRAEVEKAAVDLDARAVLLARVKALETSLAVGGVDAPTDWRDLALLKAELGEPDEAAFAYECAAFYSPMGARNNAVHTLVEQRLGSTLPSDDELMEVVLRSSVAPREAERLVTATLGRVATRNPPEDPVLQGVLNQLTNPQFPLSRRLAWLMAATWYGYADDRLGLTRARERAFGAINVSGLSEAFDVPRFARAAVALADGAEAGAETTERLELEALAETYAYNLPELDAQAAFTRLLFAVGLARVGAVSIANQLIETVDRELAAHDAPNQVLFRLFRARLAHEGASLEHEDWRREATGILAEANPEARRPAEWLARRMKWLRLEQNEDATRTLPGRMLGLLLTAEDIGFRLALVQLVEGTRGTIFEWQVVEAMEHLVNAALRTGVDDSVSDLLLGIEKILPDIDVPIHQIRAVGAVVRGAAALEDHDRVEALLGKIRDLAHREELPSIRDVLSAIKPALAVLRRLDMADKAGALLDALSTTLTQTTLDQVLLQVTLAEGFMQLKRGDEARGLLRSAFETTLSGTLSYPHRAKAATTLIDTLRHFPASERAEFGRKFMSNLSSFRDTFVVSKFFRTHQLLVLEALVDSLADARTRRSNLLRDFLDREEHAVRRRILADWRQVCGA